MRNSGILNLHVNTNTIENSINTSINNIVSVIHFLRIKYIQLETEVLNFFALYFPWGWSSNDDPILILIKHLYNLVIT